MQLTPKQLEAVNAEAEARSLQRLVGRHFRRDGSHIQISGENPPWWIMEAAGYKRPDPPPAPPRPYAANQGSHRRR